MTYETATVVETGPGGQWQANRDHGWGAVLADSTPVRVFITAKIRTLKIPTLQVGQVIHIFRHQEESERCSVEVADITWVSPSKLARLSAGSAKADSSTQD